MFVFEFGDGIVCTDMGISISFLVFGVVVLLGSESLEGDLAVRGVNGAEGRR